MVEKPFRVGHLIKVSGTVGRVEDVGFRSTRVRTLENSLISIPNNAVVNATVENLSARMRFRQRLVIQLTYGTAAEKLQAFALGLEQLLTDHPTTLKDNFHVRFNDLGESSLNFLVMFHLIVEDYAEELKERELILYQIVALAKTVGVEFAFPSRTLYVETAPTAIAATPGLRGAVGTDALADV
jgi:MscS family membrane protein